MDKDPDININDIVDTLEENDKQEDDYLGEEVYENGHRFSGLLGKILFIGGAIVLVIIIFILFPSEENNFSKTNFDTLIERVNKIEDRVKEIEGIEERMTALLRSQEENLRKNVTASAGTEARAQTEKTRYHIVRRGENLSLIASTYGLTLDELCNLNKITPRKPIHPGQKLQVSIVRR
jgi:LysM repeat protein